MATIPFVSIDRKTLEIVDRFFRQSVDEKDHRSSNYEHMQVPDTLDISSVKAVEDTQTLTLSVEDYELLDDTDKTVWVAKKASGSDVIESYEQTKTEIILVTDDTITLPTANEVLIEKIRLERNMLLRDSDKYMLDDWPHTSPAVKTAWVDYRQALRDMDTIAEDPENPKWPTKPSS
jgi:midasin (ATPase involved in ribosome maturation)